MFRAPLKAEFRPLFAALVVATTLLVFSGCSDDEKKDDGPPWFDCEPMLAKLDECGVVIAFDDLTEADPDEAYESCQFAKGNMWLAAYKCYKEKPACDDFAECLPEHGFITPAESGDDDATDDDTA